MTILIKSLLLLGVFALLGPGVAARYLGLKPGAGLGRWGRSALFFGAALTVLASLGSVLATVVAIGGFDLSLTGDYLLNSRHGRVTLLRLGLVLLLVWLGLGARLPLERPLYAFTALAFLATLSLTAHAGATGELLPVVADVLHLAAAALWLGAVMGLAFLPETYAGLAAPVAARVSRAGLLSVLTLLASGVYSASLHLFGFSALRTSTYGQALLVKLLLVAVILGLAALNRWWLLPRLGRGEGFAPLRRLVRLELLLLALVLIATGVLSSTVPTHPPGFHQEHPGHSNSP